MSDSKRVWALAVLVAAACSAVLIGTVGDEIVLTNDSERDLFRVTDWLDHGEFSWKGPDIAGMPGATLGPGWTLAVAPVVALAPGPLSVHWFHVVVLAAGALLTFAALRRIAGPWAALIGLILLLANREIFVTLRILQHVGLQPGAAMIWSGFFLFSLTSPDPRRAARAQAAAWVITALMPQLHLNAGPFMLVLGLALLASVRTRPWRAAPVATLLSWAICTALAVGYLILMRDAMQATDAASSLGLGPDVGSLLLSGLGIGYTEAAEPWSIAVVVIGAALGALRVRERGPAGRVARWSLLLLAASLAFLLVVLTRLDWAARYALGILIAAHLLVPLGLGGIFERLRRPRAGPVTFGLVTLGVLASLPFGRPPDPLGPFTAAEQEAALVALRDAGWHWADIEHRVHGPLFAGSALPWVAWAVGVPTDPPPSTVPRIALIPEGHAVPAGPAQCRPFESARGRAMQWCEVTQRLAYDDVVAVMDDRRCALPLPVHREAPGHRVQRYGLEHPHPSDCPFESRDESLRLELPEVSGDAPLHLLLAWEGNPDACARTRVATGAQTWSLECEPTQGAMGLATFDPPKGPFTLELSGPRPTFLDLY